MAVAMNDVVQWVRDILDQRPLVSEDVKTDSATVGSFSTNFSDADLINRINRAQWDIVNRCKAQHVPGAVVSYTSSFPEIDAEIIRLLHSRVFRNSVRCVQRSAERHIRLEQAGRAATAAYPTYTYEDGALYIYPDDTSGQAYIVQAPTAATAGQNLTVDERFEDALIWHVVASCFQTLHRHQEVAFFTAAYEDEISAFVLENRLSNVFDDREVSVE